MDAVRAVAASRPGHYDLVLMDIRMDSMDGCEAARRIRPLPDPGLACVPVVAMRPMPSRRTAGRLPSAA